MVTTLFRRPCRKAQLIILLLRFKCTRHVYVDTPARITMPSEAPFLRPETPSSQDVAQLNQAIPSVDP